MPLSRILSSNPTAIRFLTLLVAATRILLEAAVAPTLTLPPAQTQEALFRCQVGWNVAGWSLARSNGIISTAAPGGGTPRTGRALPCWSRGLCSRIQALTWVKVAK